VGKILDQQKKPYKHRAKGIDFDDPIWNDPFGPSWRTLIIFDRGKFWIEQQTTKRIMRYEIRSLHVFVFCLLGATMFATVGFLAEGITGLRLGLAALLWLYGMNLALAAVRVPLLFSLVPIRQR
jgi:hypothetical protein